MSNLFFFLLAIGCAPSAQSIAYKYGTEHKYQYEIINKLKLSNKQERQFNDMQAYYQDKINWMQHHVADRVKLRAEFMKMQSSFDQELQSLLSPKQYTLYLELLEGQSEINSQNRFRVQKTI